MWNLMLQQSRYMLLIKHEFSDIYFDKILIICYQIQRLTSSVIFSIAFPDYHAYFLFRFLCIYNISLNIHQVLTQKVKHKFAIWTLLGICPRGMKTCIHTKDLYVNILSSIIYNSLKLKTIQMPCDGLVEKCGLFTQWNIIQQ